VLRDWNDGTIGYYTSAPVDTTEHVIAGSAVLVNGFGKDFDLAGMDDVAVKSGKDEEDCVEMQVGEEGGDINWKDVEGETSEEEGEDDEEMGDEDEDDEESEAAMDESSEEEEEKQEEEMKKPKGKKVMQKFSRKDLDKAEDFF
jgi:hypothetical protein